MTLKSMDLTDMNLYKRHYRQNCLYQFPIQMGNHAWVPSSFYHIQIVETNTKIKIATCTRDYDIESYFCFISYLIDDTDIWMNFSTVDTPIRHKYSEFDLKW